MINLHAPDNYWLEVKDSNGQTILLQPFKVGENIRWKAKDRTGIIDVSEITVEMKRGFILANGG